MDDAELCRLIDRQSKQAIGADDMTADQRSEAYEYYHGEAKGKLAAPDTPGRSAVVSKDLMDTVEWAMPGLMDVFASADDIVRFEPDSHEDEQACNDATNYIGWLIHRKNEDGFVTIHDAVKSALLCRMGVGKCFVDKSQDYREEQYNGLAMSQVQLLEQDPEIELIEVLEGATLQPFDMQQGMPPDMMATFNVRARRTSEVLQFRNEGVPPEEVRIAKDTRVINECRFIEHRREVTRSYLREQGYDEAKIEALAEDDEGQDDQDLMSRHEYDDSDPDGDEATDQSQRKVWLSESYLRVDFDEDGRTEYRRVVKVRNTVFENDVVDDHPFWLMTPILMPYKVIGMSFFDLVEDLQRIKTALTRQVLDNVYLANNPRTEVVESQIIDMDELLYPRIGGIVRTKSMNATREIVTPFVGAAGLQLIQSFDAISDTRTGVTEMNSAMSAESFAQSNVGSQGVQALMNAGAQRIRLIARVLAETGFKRMYYLMLKNVTQYQNRLQQVKINGRWLDIDPREWKNRYNMTISVGVGTFGRQQQVANLTMLMQVQEKLSALGLAGPQQAYQTATRLAEAMGYRDADQFFSGPQTGPDGKPAPMPQQPQPGQAEAQALIQSEQIKAQATMQKAQMDNETRLIVEREKIASAERVAMFKAQQEISLQREQSMRQAINQGPYA